MKRNATVGINLGILRTELHERMCEVSHALICLRARLLIVEGIVRDLAALGSTGYSPAQVRALVRRAERATR